MPLPECINPKDIITHEIQDQPRSEDDIVQLVKSLVSKRNWPLTQVVYIIDIAFHDCNRRRTDNEDSDDKTSEMMTSSTDKPLEPIVNVKKTSRSQKSKSTSSRSRYPWNTDTLLDFRRYEIVFLDNSSTKVLNYSHKICTGTFTHSIVEIANKPKLDVRELIIPIRGVRYIKEQGEHQVRIRLNDIYNKAIQDLGAQGFPQFDSTKQSYHLCVDYYYLNQLIKKQELSWNPHKRIHDTDATGLEEHVEMLKDRPDHVRLADVRLGYVSLFWLQEWINKILDERLA